MLGNEESPFIQPDDAVDWLTNSFLFLLHKQHRSSNNKNHKKMKRSGTVPRPEHINSFQFFTLPLPPTQTLFCILTAKWRRGLGRS